MLNKPVNNSGWLSGIATLLLFYIHMTATVHINHCDVPIQYQMSITMKFVLPCLQALNDQSLVSNLESWQRSLILVWIWLNYISSHFCDKLCWFTWQGRSASINLLICQNWFTVPVAHTLVLPSLILSPCEIYSSWCSKKAFQGLDLH